MHQLLSIYAELSSLYSLSERARMDAHMQGTVFTLARLKIAPTIKNLYHIQCQCVDELCCSV